MDHEEALSSTEWLSLTEWIGAAGISTNVSVGDIHIGKVDTGFCFHDREEKRSIGPGDTISVVGLGNLGLTFSAVLLQCGFNVLGVDSDPELCERLNNGEVETDEPFVEKWLTERKNFFQAISWKLSPRIIQETDVTFIYVPTQDLEACHYHYNNVLDVLIELSLLLESSGKKNHTFVVGSTLPIGSCMNSLVPEIERISERKMGNGVGLVYSPEFVALGNIFRDLIDPSMTIIAASDGVSRDIITDLFECLHSSGNYIHHMSFGSAELTKLAINVYVSMKISYANMLTGIAEQFVDIDVDAVTAAMQDDPRVGYGFLRGGTPFGGRCFPVDVQEMLSLLNAYELSGQSMIDGVQVMNEDQYYRLETAVEKALVKLLQKSEYTISVIGMAFKPGIKDVTNSPSMALYSYLSKIPDVKVLYSDLLDPGSTPIDVCLAESDVVVLMHQGLGAIIESNIPPMKKLFIVDPWRQINEENLDEHVSIIALGRWQPKTEVPKIVYPATQTLTAEPLTEKRSVVVKRLDKDGVLK